MNAQLDNPAARPFTDDIHARIKMEHAVAWAKAEPTDGHKARAIVAITDLLKILLDVTPPGSLWEEHEPLLSAEGYLAAIAEVMALGT